VRKCVLTVFGTRPEAIKLAPVVRELAAYPDRLRPVVVNSGQHQDLLAPFLRHFAMRVTHDLQVMEPGQTPSGVCARVLARLDPVLVQEQPDLILVQGDTTTALAAALAGFHRGVPVGHVEAGLRSGDPLSPFPEEMNRRLITRLATYHFAATLHNRRTLMAEGVEPGNIHVTGNPVVDALHAIRDRSSPTPTLAALLATTRGLKRLVLTTHRRESFGRILVENLRVLRGFVDRHPDVVLIFPVHPNPAVAEAAHRILSGHARVHLVSPLAYDDFVILLSQAWLIVSDSGGLQEEAPSLGRPVLVLRTNTERPEAIESGVARLVGGFPGRLAHMLEEAHQNGVWLARAANAENPFGHGDSGKRIARAVLRILHCEVPDALVPALS
jgi:UDP-N-acetylglucosamine 2-epimerase (non-hydrolysing)